MDYVNILWVIRQLQLSKAELMSCSSRDQILATTLVYSVENIIPVDEKLLDCGIFAKYSHETCRIVFHVWVHIEWFEYIVSSIDFNEVNIFGQTTYFLSFPAHVNSTDHIKNNKHDQIGQICHHWHVWLKSKFEWHNLAQLSHNVSPIYPVGLWSLAMY